MKRIWWIVGIGIGFCILLAVYGVLPCVMAKYHAHVIVSGSMQPTLAPGSIVITRVMQPMAYQQDNIISFIPPTSPNQIVTHRIARVFMGEGGVREFQTKGDSNSNGDSWVLSAGNIEGKVMWVMPWAGYLIWALQTPTGFLGGALLILIFAVVPYFWQPHSTQKPSTHISNHV